MTGALYLFPTPAHAEPPSRARVQEVLADAGVIGEAAPGGGFLVGKGFLQQMTFAGCSPHFEFAPPSPGSRNYCHVEILGPYPAARMLVGPHTTGPRCPHCGTRLKHWRDMRAAWEQVSGSSPAWPCPACGAEASVENWRWRSQAAFGRLLVCVHQVFPAEGVPSANLLTALEAATGVAWTYAWAGQPGDAAAVS
jgi:hypothetical protein